MIAGNVGKAFRIARIRQFVEIHNLHITLGREQVPNKIRPDKARTTGHKNLHAVSPFCSNLSVMSMIDAWFYSPSRACRGGTPRPGILFAPDSATMFVARSNESNVPASVHQPSRLLCVRVPSRRYILFTSVISSSLRQLGLAFPIFSNTL